MALRNTKCYLLRKSILKSERYQSSLFSARNLSLGLILLRPRGRMFKTNLQMFAYIQSRGLAPLLVLLVCLLFLFPVKVGSFQSTHGPTTTLEESMFFLLLQISLLVVGSALLSFRLLPAVGRCFGVLDWSADDRTTHDHALVSLRC